MTDLNFNTNINKDYLLSLVAKPVFINKFNSSPSYFEMPAGLYLIDAIIFHFDGHIEIGVSEYDPSTPLEQFDIDKSHIAYFNLQDLDINYEQAITTSLINNQAA